MEKSLRVGGSNYEKNVFTNSSVGVYVSKNQDVTVGYNSFNTISGSAAIYMYNCATEGNAISITSNSIDNCYTAIYSLGGAGSSTIDIANNKINQNVKTINSKASKGITISNTTLNPIATLPIVTIVANHIKRVSTGIEVTNYRTPSIRLNQLSELSNLTATTPSNGLLFTACPSITVEGNTVTGVGAELWWMNGIRIEPGCSNGLLLSNTVADIGRGILFLGTNLSAKMIKNTLKNNTDGLVLGSSIIGYQLGDGTSCKAQENKWQGTFSQSNILSINSNGEQSPFNFLAQTNPSWVPEMKTPATIVSIAQGGGTPVPAFSCNNNSGYREIDDETGPIQTDLLNKLAKDEISFPLYNASTKWWVKYNLYDMLQTDVKLQDNPQLKAFAKTNAVGNIGELYQLNQSLNNHIAIDTEVIRVAGRGFTPQNKLEKNLQVVYDIIVANRTSQTLNDVEIQQLQTIAKLCPYESGPAVFNARVLLSSIENTTYSNPCESIPFGEVVTNTEQDLENTMSDPTKSVVVFPNPATDKLTLVNHLNAGE